MVAKLKKQPVHPVDTAHMTFDDYLYALGGKVAGYRMCREIGVHQAILPHLHEGEPVAAPIADKVAGWLSKEYERTIKPAAIEGLNIIQ